MIRGNGGRAIAAIASIKVDFGGNGGHAGAALMPQW